MPLSLHARDAIFRRIHERRIHSDDTPGICVWSINSIVQFALVSRVEFRSIRDKIRPKRIAKAHPAETNCYVIPIIFWYGA